ncbi:MAG TPA: hypothetical protein VGL81_28455 [Polyangiaceae bacterium]|jgi:hypothetical protein
MPTARARYALTAVVVASVSAVACGSGGGGSTFKPPAGDDGGGTGLDGSLTGDGGGSDSSFISNRTVTGLSISPSQVTIQSLDGAPSTQQFQAVAQFSDGTSSPVPGAAWSRDNPQVGAIAGTGLYTANGSQGGVVDLTATYQGQTATAKLLVQLQIQQNPGNVAGNVQGSLQAATATDTTVTWAYPYDGTVFPRGVGEAPLMWMNGAASDQYLVRLTSATFELETYVTAATGRYDFDATTWQEFTDSTSGSAELKVSRWNGTTATVATDLHWTVAPASMRGTIYYWAINTGRVMRIQPGATAPDDFLGASVTCPSCHTVSANGQSLLMNEGLWPQETSFDYDLKAASTAYSGFSSNNNGASEWALPGVSPDGTVVVENWAPLRGNIGTQTGAFTASTGVAIPSTGLEGNQLWMPAFSPDGKLLAYVDATTHDLRAYDWDPVGLKATNDRLIVASASNAAQPQIQFPTVSPDHLWIIYGRGTALGSLGVPGDLYVASVASPGTEIALASLNGATYPFAAGTRDRDLDYEPTFAPVAAGGYFWVVFHSRRTWGNALTGPAFVAEGTGVKQLWVAAFDQAPAAGKDPSHSAFYLPGQDSTTLNMRGYWALDPCEGDGLGCQSGTQCCGGYCAPAAGDAGAGDGGGFVCASSSSGCAQDGDKCSQSSDCCGASSGTTCINGVCSEPPPQ